MNQLDPPSLEYLGAPHALLFRISELLGTLLFTDSA
jgi:hypothetical protein